MNYYDYDDSAYLAHFGIKGMKWGIRRFQNEDGSLSEAGKKRYGQGKHLLKTNRNIRKDVRKMRRNMIKDTVKEAFSDEARIGKNDVPQIIPGAGRIAYQASKFSKTGLKNAMNRNKQVAANYKSHMEGTYGDKYKKLKRRQIVKAATAGATLAAIGGGALIYNAAKKHEKNKPPKYGSKRANNYISYRKDKDMINQYKHLGMM